MSCLLAAGALSLFASLPAQADSAAALDSLPDDALPGVVRPFLSRIELDAAITGFEQAARSAANGQPAADHPALEQARRSIEQSMAQAGPQLAHHAAAFLTPLLRAWRAELARDMAGFAD